jgi:ketosteroid isomerase-like protein
MIRVLAASIFLLPCPVSARMPPAPAAGPLVAQGADEKAVRATIDALFAAFERGDSAAMLRQVYPDGRVTASGRRADGASNLRPQSWTMFAERITPQRAFQERIANASVHVNDDIAVVWAPFVVRVGGKVSNCGIDHFDLVRENGA